MGLGRESQGGGTSRLVAPFPDGQGRGVQGQGSLRSEEATPRKCARRSCVLPVLLPQKTRDGLGMVEGISGLSLQASYNPVP